MKLSLKKILVLAGALLGVVAFFMMFVDAIKVSVTTVVIGNSSTDVSYYSGLESLFGVKNNSGDIVVKGAGGAFVGYLLALLGGAAAVVSALVIKDKKMAMYIVIGAAALMVVGAVLMFCEKAMFLGVNEIDSASGAAGLGSILGASYEYGLGAGPIVGGILAILGAGCAGASIVVKEK